MNDYELRCNQVKWAAYKELITVLNTNKIDSSYVLAVVNYCEFFIGKLLDSDREFLVSHLKRELLDK